MGNQKQKAERAFITAESKKIHGELLKWEARYGVRSRHMEEKFKAEGGSPDVQRWMLKWEEFKWLYKKKTGKVLNGPWEGE